MDIVLNIKLTLRNKCCKFERQHLCIYEMGTTFQLMPCCTECLATLKGALEIEGKYSALYTKDRGDRRGYTCYRRLIAISFYTDSSYF